MSRAGKAFELGGIILPVAAGLGIAQRVEVIGGRTRLRFANGAGLNQVAWEKLRITLSGQGWCPPGLHSLDYAAPLVLKCGAPRSITGPGPAITLPAARRTDTGYAPYAWAHTARGPQNTPVTLAGNVATCTTVPGAISYTVMYYPQLTVLCDPPTDDFDTATGQSAWELVAEEQ